MTVDHREFIRTSLHYSDGWNQGAETPRTRDEAWHFDEVRKVRDCPVGMSGVGLEAGCGDGRDTIRLTLANPAATVCSVDLSEGVFIAAQRLRDLAIPNGRIHRANLAHLPFADASFDWAYSYGVLHHMPEPEDGMREIGRVLKRWRLRRAAIDRLAGAAPADLAALDTAVRVLRRDGLDNHADHLAALAAKVRALSDAALSRSRALDLEDLIAAEGLALRPGPRRRVKAEVLATLRHAALACFKVRIAYRYRMSGRRSHDIVHPYGFLYGNRHWLVAWSENERARDMRLYEPPR